MTVSVRRNGLGDGRNRANDGYNWLLRERASRSTLPSEAWKTNKACFGTWLQLSLAVTTPIAAMDFAINETILMSFLVVDPLLASVRETPRRSGLVGAYALLLAIVLGIPDRIFGSLDHAIRCSAVAAGGLLAMWASRVRIRYQQGDLVRGVEDCWKRKDGSPLWVELHFHAKKDEQVWSRNREGFLLDIADRKRNGAETLSVKEQLGRSQRGYLQVEFNV